MPKYRVGSRQTTIFDVTRSWTSLLFLAMSRQNTNRSEPLRRAPRCIRKELTVRCLDEFAVRPHSHGHSTLLFDEQDLYRDRPQTRIDGSC